MPEQTTPNVNELKKALRDCLAALKDSRQWELIEAADKDGRTAYKGFRHDMPAGLVEVDNQAGVPPEEIQPLYDRIERLLDDGHWRKLEPGEGEEEIVIQNPCHLESQAVRQITLIANEVHSLALPLGLVGAAKKTLRVGEIIALIRDLAKQAPPTPAVIEGKGQAVEKPGVYISLANDAKDEDDWDWSTKFEGDLLYAENRYIYFGPIPKFPPLPRPAFVAPERPEFVLVRFKVNGTVTWLDKRRINDFTECEVIDETTGEPAERNV